MNEGDDASQKAKPKNWSKIKAPVFIFQVGYLITTVLIVVFYSSARMQLAAPNKENLVSLIYNSFQKTGVRKKHNDLFRAYGIHLLPSGWVDKFFVPFFLSDYEKIMKKRWFVEFYEEHINCLNRVEMGGKDVVIRQKRRILKKQGVCLFVDQICPGNPDNRPCSEDANGRSIGEIAKGLQGYLRILKKGALTDSMDDNLTEMNDEIKSMQTMTDGSCTARDVMNVSARLGDVLKKTINDYERFRPPSVFDTSLVYLKLKVLLGIVVAAGLFGAIGMRVFEKIAGL